MCVPETFMLNFDMSRQPLWLCRPEAALIAAVLGKRVHRLDMQLETVFLCGPVLALSTAVPRLLVLGPDVPSQGRLEGEPGVAQLAQVVLQLQVHRIDVGLYHSRAGHLEFAVLHSAVAKVTSRPISF